MAFMLPLRWQDAYLFNGWVASPGDLFVSSSPEGYFSAGGARETLGIGLRAEHFVATLAALNGVDPEPVAIKDSRLELEATRAGSLRRMLLGALDLAGMQDNEAVPSAVSQAVEELVLSELINAYLTIRPYPKLGRGRWLPTLTIVRKAEEFLQATAQRPVRMAELCAATGVGTTALNTLFRQIYGHPPLEPISKLLSARL